ncbi:MAG: hypothetical protein ABFC80_03815 [Coriobacteriales bacterium]
MTPEQNEPKSTISLPLKAFHEYQSYLDEDSWRFESRAFVADAKSDIVAIFADYDEAVVYAKLRNRFARTKSEDGGVQ